MPSISVKTVNKKQTNTKELISDYNITKESVKKLDIPDSKDAKCFPICGEFKISLKKSIDYVNLQEDIHFNKFFSIAYKEIYDKEIKKGKIYMIY